MPAPTRAKYLITTADDFVVDVFWNGLVMPREKRKILREIYGATVERMEIEVRAGDWLVFNVVNNAMRWDGMCYFGLAGCLGDKQFGFVSRVGDSRWWVCDRPAVSEAFIAGRTVECVQPAVKPEKPWDQGDGLMQQHAGADWSGPNWKGSAVWGRGRNTWIKVLVD